MTSDEATAIAKKVYAQMTHEGAYPREDAQNIMLIAIALVEAHTKGTVDCIESGHDPHGLRSKKEPKP